MTRSTSTFTLSVLVSIFSLLAFQATANTAVVPPTVDVDGGPRTVVQGRSAAGAPAIEVSQPVPEQLSITVVDEDGNVVAATTAVNGRAVICTSGWAEGDYTVQSIDDDADYQEETITID